ncbi:MULTISPECIES: phospho-N-acetylmuramoyl-pentapeptide-transferase [Cellulophaga]|jgi:phospho-N-acetylmuramoyl-pentapeptide-transferase|uniref:Phospho-N-acetylmuramoyl-pentapeptide-transferase n=1 Tax=Cellulophaga baltica TaxID=76594 RepID=A0A1G7CQC5_9FLAO|nr:MULTISPECIES: phospho-N-acetylmuramoyl-pentapeptide-transferase [Cellulophaga]WFO17970.1 phospho-N-acetylmuramoyl-pentapeptide-transferase [Cellulophaga baltica 4]AIY13223.1 phospho-N-acetylmuramoyl-pentapeptide-transferase [Cellulophaga baltica NN016038]KGK31767.1 phospho-N-acetylmuramoyl-pentapeptide-transferase [Cellulophaga sp. E6(2014)]MBA6313213.1 phospho-N-acetylmuramoyl-pentapeptide-transferase [Cellulophaga baltica]MCR1023816.1 phospho-N-acetylmuramoyl-pentapeptide-transferase [Cel
MLYYLFEFLEDNYQIPGAGLFQFITFRAALAVLTSLLIATVYGKKIILFLQKKQIGETVRDLGLDGQKQKAGTPTMGGLIIILATLIPVLLFAKLDNIYVILLIVTTIWMGIIGFVDDYIKIFKKDKEGLKGRFKILGQVVLGLIVGATLYFHPEVTMKERSQSVITTSYTLEKVAGAEVKSVRTTVPFFKNNELDYTSFIGWMGDGAKEYAWLIFIPVVIIIVTAVSNGANLTDGIDGLAAGSSAIIVLTLGIFTWISGNIIFSNYLDIMFIPRAGELVVFVAAFVGALVGFLWYNAFPAQVFMGDTGSLTIGGVIAVIAIIIRKELLIPVLCGIFFAESISVMLQVGYFKYTKKKFGEGKRVFLMAPLHHHYQKKGYHESKIVTRFWIVGILLAVITVVTLKVR